MSEPSQPVAGRPPGVCLPHRACSASDAVRLAQRAEALGYDSVWISELATYDAFAVAGAVAMCTDQIRIGTAIVPVTTRTPALHAMSASTFGWLAPGRAIVGYGVSTPEIIEGWHGQDAVAAVGATRDLFTILDQALGGERTAHDGRRLQSYRFRLEAPAPAPPLRYIGALGERMRELTRERADGLILNFAPRSRLAAVSARERPRPEFELALPLRVAVEPGADTTLRFRREQASYLRVAPYAAALREFGYGEVVDQLGDGSLTDIARALPRAFVDDMWAAGSADACAQTLHAVRHDGVTPLLVPVIEPGDIAAFERTITALA